MFTSSATAGNNSYARFYLVLAAFLLAGFPCFGNGPNRDFYKNTQQTDVEKFHKAPAGKRISPEELARQRREIEERRTLMKAKNEQIQKGKNIYDNSVILAVNGTHTVLPDGAVAYVPEHHAEKVVEKPTGKFVLWPEFYRDNVAWIRTVEITYEQATGAEPIDEQRIKALRRGGSVVVTLFQKHPISFRGIMELPEEGRP